MGFFSKLFKKKTKETETFTFNMFGKDVTVDISDQARAKYAARYKELEESAWEGDNEVERIRDDGYVIYKSNRVTSYEREQVGFYGLKWFSF